MNQPAQLTRLDGQDFVLDEVRFKVVIGPDYHTRSTDADGVVLLKGFDMAAAESAAAEGPIRSMLELGIWQGGSAAFWALTRPGLTRYVGIDLAEVRFTIPRVLGDDPRWAKVRLYGGVSQDDRAKVRGIVEREFSGPLDLVVDDASHSYDPSLASFELLFPLIREHGTYILEDWGWAHWQGSWQEPTHHKAHEPALSSLLLRLVLLCTARPDIISKVVVRPGFAVVSRGSAALDDAFRVEPLIPARGKPLPLL